LRRSRYLSTLALGTAFTVVLALGPAGGSQAFGTVHQTVRSRLANSSLKFRGRVNVHTLAAHASTAARTAPAASGNQVHLLPRLQPKTTQAAHQAAPTATSANSKVVMGAGAARAFDGIDHADQRLVDGGNQFSTEPPDGAICQGRNSILEDLNSGLQFFSPSGALQTPTISLTDFYGLPVPIDRTNGTFGPFSLGDIKCVFDQATNRFFILAWGTSQDFFSGAFTGQNVYFLGVQATNDPLGSYNLYSINLSPPGSPGCRGACFADHPTASTDANTFVTTYNEYNVVTGRFNGARLVVLSKADLEAGLASPVVLMSAGRLGGGLLYTLQGGNVPRGGTYSSARDGTMFFVSALEFTGTGDTRVAVEALSHTNKIDSNPGALSFQASIVRHVLFYVAPPKAPQKPGEAPLGDSLGEPLNVLDSGSDETQPAKWAGGDIWTVIDTQVGSGSSARGGLLYLAVRPVLSGGTLTGTVQRQGYVSVARNWLLYGNLAVRGNGTRPVIVASLAGPGVFPSSVYGTVGNNGGVSTLWVYAAGARPDDGFTCYPEFDPEATTRGCRYGDYNEVNWGQGGNFYMESEYMTPRFRTSLANWGTGVAILPAAA